MLRGVAASDRSRPAAHIRVAQMNTYARHRLWCTAYYEWIERCVAACCSVLQRVAACCSVLQRVAACCSVLQRVAACCGVLQFQQVIGLLLHQTMIMTHVRMMHRSNAYIYQKRTIATCVRYMALRSVWWVEADIANLNICSQYISLCIDVCVR